MWVSILYKSCNKNAEFEDFQDDVIENVDEVPSITEDVQNDAFFQEDEVGEDIKEESQAIDYDELDQKIEEAERPDPEPKTTTSQPVSTGSSYGRFMVIAGSYLLESNADAMVNKLQKLGYEAEKVNFDLSQFHSVCAGRYDDYTEAVQANSELKRRGIDSYVHRKK